MSIDSSQLKICAEELKFKGWSVSDSLFSPQLSQQLLDDLKSLIARKALTKSTLGKNRDLKNDMRGDFIYWLDSSSAAQKEFLEDVNSLRAYLNQNLFLNLCESEFHFAHYPPFTHYDKHRDTFKDSDARTVSFVLYLNSDWNHGDGGELYIYGENDNDEVVEKISPRFSRCVLFLSALFPHEVKMTKSERFSVTGWLKKPSGSRF